MEINRKNRIEIKNRLLKPEIFPVRFGFGFTTKTDEPNRPPIKIKLETSKRLSINSTLNLNLNDITIYF
jgi:hypothetical protein